MTDQIAESWRYFALNIPDNPRLKGIRVSLKNITSGVPRMVIRKGTFMPKDFTTTSGLHSDGTWLDNQQWAQTGDFTGLQRDSAGVVASGRYFLAAYDAPMGPGSYIIGVSKDSSINTVSNPNTPTMSYTVMAEGIGEDMVIPITPIDFDNSATPQEIVDLPEREMMFYKVTVPLGQHSWRVRLGIGREKQGSCGGVPKGDRTRHDELDHPAIATGSHLFPRDLWQHVRRFDQCLILGINIPDGEHTIAWRYARDSTSLIDGENRGYVDQLRFVRDGAGIDPLQFWLADHFTESELADPEISGLNADPDGDGIVNLIEAAIGTSPKSPDSMALLLSVISTHEAGGNRTIRLAANRALSPVQNLKLEIQASDSLTGGAWSTLVEKTGDGNWLVRKAGVTPPLEGAAIAGSVPFSFDESVALPDSAHRFYRLAVSVVPSP